ncbi:DNA gyrase/topoisomerase IV, A subunit, partial [Necator americanus]
WGVRALCDIPAGAFIANYVGALLTDSLADALQGEDEYFADLDLNDAVENEKATTLEKCGYLDMGIGSSDEEEEPMKSGKDADDDGLGWVCGPSKATSSLIVGFFRSDASSSSSNEDEEPRSKRSRRRKPNEEEGVNPRRKKLNAAELEKIDAAAAVGDDTVFKWADYFGENNTLFVVDAKKKGNVGRFLNHSCDPNVQVQHVFVDTHDLRLPWSSFFAIRNIKAGEELCWNYGYSPDALDPDRPRHRQLFCKCGANSCRGRLLSEMFILLQEILCFYYVLQIDLEQILLSDDLCVLRMRRCAISALRYSPISAVYGAIRPLSASSLRLLAKVKKSTTNPIVESLRYERKSPIEHILLRPDTYVGSTDISEDTDAWVVCDDGRRMVQKRLHYSPALLKIFDEILVNAADNKQRDPEMNELRVDVDRERGKITLFNNGRGLPIEIHPKEGIYVPMLIFGNLFTSSNYDDREVKVVGGRNGYGAKLCNIFSKEFVVETWSQETGRSFKQIWKNNMRDCDEPVVSESQDLVDGTRITFSPDLAKFGLSKLDDDICEMFKKRTFDVAGTLRGVVVYYNGELVEVGNTTFRKMRWLTIIFVFWVPSFREYVDLYSDDSDDVSSNNVLFVNASKRWQWAVKRSGAGFQQISFVNNIGTTGGGKHVDYITDQLLNIIKPLVDSYLKTGIKKNAIKNKICVFVNALIENPAFSSQTKEILTTAIADFGSKCICDVTSVQTWAMESGLVDELTCEALAKEGRPAKKVKPKTEDLSDIVKLEDANWVGDATHSQDCRLLVTEGDSAKALAVAGLEVVGRDRYGVFPVMGKFMNVSGLKKEKLEAAASKEVNQLMRILGLKYGEDYSIPENRAKLRYGGIIILTDQDEDGSHIKGLIINFLHTFWPELLRNGFIQTFITPLLKARRGSESYSFYSMDEFKKWEESTEDAAKYTVKYYKGLGTSTSKEAREYFSNFEKHLVSFRYDGEKDDEKIRMAFEKRRSDDRKRWISERLQSVELPEATQNGTYANEATFSEFVDHELFRYSLLDLKRSIPSVVDGLKPSQRKVMHTLLRRNSNKEIKVNQLAAAVALNEAYHHGEATLVTTIVRMAQDFVGMNNVCLLEPLGQFGTRHEGGDDAASSRYIYTCLKPITRLIFPAADDGLLNYLQEENQRVEPDWYCPVIPVVLVNGADGVATGWSTHVLSHSILEVIDNVRRLIDGDEIEKMVHLLLSSKIPSFSGFSGKIEEIGENSYEIRGKFKIIPSHRKNASNLSIEITELPVGEWTNRYKQNTLNDLQSRGLISGFKEYHTERGVRFVVELGRDFTARCRKTAGRHSELMKKFKLSTTITTKSMVLFDPYGHLKKYTSVADVMHEHFQVRKQKYKERKQYETRMLDAQKRRVENQVKT